MDTTQLVVERTNVGALERLTSVSVGAMLLGNLARQRSVASVAGAILGADLLYRGVTGQCQLYRALGINTAGTTKVGSQVDPASPRVQRSITVKGTPEDLYHAWQDPKTLAAVMAHFAEVQDIGEGITLWQVKGPLRKELQWNSRYTVEDLGRELSWESLPGTQLPNQGTVTFRPAPNGLGTVVTVTTQFEPPLGTVGLEVSKLFRALPSAISGASLRRFKSLMETGEIPTLVNNPSGRGQTDLV